MKLAGKIKRGDGSTLKNLGASLGLNAAQTIGGNAIQETADNMIMGEKSHYESQLRRYIQQQGLSREAAEKAVLLDELRAAGSIAPFVSGVMLHGASWGMRMLNDAQILRQMQELGPLEKKFDPDVTPYTEEDFRIAQSLQEDAPRNPFTMESERDRMGVEPTEETTGTYDFGIGKSVGAKAKNYDVFDPQTGRAFQFVEGTHIQDSQVFAGYGSRTPLHEGVAEGLSKQFGGTVEKWQHVKGFGYLDMDGEEVKVEVHWFQNPDIGKCKFKVKKRYN